MRSRRLRSRQVSRPRSRSFRSRQVSRPRSRSFRSRQVSRPRSRNVRSHRRRYRGDGSEYEYVNPDPETFFVKDSEVILGSWGNRDYRKRPMGENANIFAKELLENLQSIEGDFADDVDEKLRRRSVIIHAGNPLYFLIDVLEVILEKMNEIPEESFLRGKVKTAHEKAESVKPLMSKAYVAIFNESETGLSDEILRQSGSSRVAVSNVVGAVQDLMDSVQDLWKSANAM